MYPSLTWNKPTKNKVIYVTFDDGPIPEVTPEVLRILSEYNAKATFFCVGDNIVKHPAIYQSLLLAGHTVGNHTYNHINGWGCSVYDYLNNVKKCANRMPEARLFRPAYGKIKRRAIPSIKKMYEVIMWDVLAGDFDQNLSKEACLRNTIEATTSGSIIIFHDSLKAKENMLYALPKFLAYFKEQGFEFKSL